MTKYIHKDKQFFNEACKLFPSFSKRFKEACERQMKDDSNCILVKRKDFSKGFHWAIYIPKSDIEVRDGLKPYVWYSCREFDGNPNNYVLVEKVIDLDGNFLSAYMNKDISLHYICPSTTKFMYIERPE